MGVDFNVAVEQLRVVNPDVDIVTKGTDPFYRMVNGKITVPEDLVNEDNQEEDDDV